MIKNQVGTVVFSATYAEDGTATSVVVERADRMIAVTMEVLASAGPGVRFLNGLLVLGTAGTHAYRPVRFSDDGAIVCRLINNATRG